MFSIFTANSVYFCLSVKNCITSENKMGHHVMKCKIAKLDNKIKFINFLSLLKFEKNFNSTLNI